MERLTQILQQIPIVQISITVCSIIVYLILRQVLFGRILKRAMKNSFHEGRARYIRKAIGGGVLFLLLAFLAMVWDVSLEGLSIYVASFLTIVGVGLFANWSIVSNITASVILFFFFPFRIGSKVRVVDGDNSAEGVVMDLSLFSITLKDSAGNSIYVPNNIAIQKSIIHLDHEGDQA